jgi:hypothetical protein
MADRKVNHYADFLPGLLFHPNQHVLSFQVPCTGQPNMVSSVRTSNPNYSLLHSKRLEIWTLHSKRLEIWTNYFPTTDIGREHHLTENVTL